MAGFIGLVESTQNSFFVFCHTDRAVGIGFMGLEPTLKFSWG
jgi:hypothetical protein